jgi:hypothetical protein
MPYIGLTITGNDNIRKYIKSERENLNFSDDQLNKAYKFELVHSAFSDPGNDWNSWRLYDANDIEISRITLDGY